MTCPHPMHYRDAAGRCRICQSRRRSQETASRPAVMRKANASLIERRELARLDGLRRVLNELVAEGLLEVEYDQEGAARFALVKRSSHAHTA